MRNGVIYQTRKKIKKGKNHYYRWYGVAEEII